MRRPPSGPETELSVPAAPVRERLRFLYGQEAGDRTAAGLERLIERHRKRAGPRPGRAARFDERDVLLITYGDTLLDPPRPPLQALGDFARQRLAGLVSGIHLLPFFPWSSDYGFSVIDHLEVKPDLGDWDDLLALGRKFRLMFDFVLNHVSAESPWFRAFLRGEPPYDRFFITMDPGTDLSAVTRPRTTPLLTRFESAAGERWVWTTFSADQVDLDYRNPEVLLRMVDVMLTYVERGAAVLRLDAAGYLWKEVGTSCIHLPQTHEVIRVLREALDAVAPDVAIVTETNVPQRDNVSYFGDGHDEAQMVYQFPLAPLVLDAFARADATHLGRWAVGLTTPSESTAFFNLLASHDGVGLLPAQGLLPDGAVAGLVRQVLAQGGQVSTRTDPGGGEGPYELNSTFFDALSDPHGGERWALRRDRFLCSQAIMLALAGVPGVYVHSLFGSHNDQEAFARTGWKRDLNHGRLSLAEISALLQDPTSETAQVFAGYGRLLSARRAHPAFHPNAPQRVLNVGPGVFALERTPMRARPVLALHNLSADPQPVAATAGVDLLTGRRHEGGPPLVLAPFEVLWLEREPATKSS